MSARAARAVFPPEQVAEVKALVCELPATQRLPFSRFSRTELHRLVVERGLSAASASTIWRWLHDDALKPWQQRSWIFVRDPDFREKAGRVLDLYQRRFEGRRLRPDEYVICADEKSQLQALGRKHATQPPAPGRAVRFEFDYQRNGTVAYLAGWDRLPGQPVRPRRRQDRDQAVRAARRRRDDDRAVRLGAHRLLDRRQRLKPRRPGQHQPAGRRLLKRAADPPADPRLLAQPDRALLLDRPTQGAQPKRLRALDALAERLLGFGDHYRQIAQPFEWTFTRADLNRLLARIETHQPALTLAA